MSHALIIEGDWFVAFSIQEGLSKLGYFEFDIVESVKEAIGAAQKRCPHLIIADHQVTDGTGTDAVLAICSDKAVPVVWVTASGQEVRNRVPDALVVDKPFSFPRLSAAVSAAAEGPFRHSSSR